LQKPAQTDSFLGWKQRTWSDLSRVTFSQMWLTPHLTAPTDPSKAANTLASPV